MSIGVVYVHNNPTAIVLLVQEFDGVNWGWGGAGVS